jgi:hypothetical protein
MYLSGLTEPKSLEGLLVDIIEAFLKKEDLPMDEITVYIKDQLRKQWRL